MQCTAYLDGAVQCIYIWLHRTAYLDGGSAMYIFGCIVVHIWMGAVQCIYWVTLDCIYLVRDAVQGLFGSSAMHIFGCKRCAVHICFCFKTASVEYLVCGESASNWVRPVGVW